MSQKNEIPALIGSLMVTTALIGGGIWWFTQKSGINPGQLTQPVAQSNSPNRQPPNAPNSGGAVGVDTFSHVQKVPQRSFNYGGSTSWAPLRGQNSVDGAIQIAQPGFKLRYVNPNGSLAGSGTGIRMLMDGQLDFAQSARPISPAEYQQAEQRGFKLKQVAVAIDGLALAVHPTLTIPGLTLEQVKSIYRGQITNWQAVGGPNLPITPLSRASSGGTVEFFVETVMAGQALGSTVQIMPTTTAALRKLTDTPGGIYFASAPEVVPQCGVKPIAIGQSSGQFVPPYQTPLVPTSQCPAQRNQLNASAFQSGQYPLTRSLFVIVKENGQIEQQAGEAYANLLLSNQGQNLIGQAGFVKIR
jgi:phosphate transport system substrate-binding protein